MLVRRQCFFYCGDDIGVDHGKSISQTYRGRSKKICSSVKV